MKTEEYLAIAVQNGVATETETDVEFNGVIYPNTPEGRVNCGIAVAMATGEDVE